ncbi:unnamed protein product [Rangifer tarandus platyrhynchus]|uniref:Uncharacterized protein n=1 Tax=Rangifer tarandus platyrhynchus TaxID=3082113 RepID=A0AC59YFK5_RANTA
MRGSAGICPVTSIHPAAASSANSPQGPTLWDVSGQDGGARAQAHPPPSSSCLRPTVRKVKCPPGLAVDTTSGGANVARMGSVDPAVFSLRLSWSLRDGRRLRLVSCPGTCRAGAPPAGPPGRGPRGSTPFPPQQRDSRLQCGRGANRWHKRPGLARGSPSVPPGCLCGPEGLRARAPRRAGPGPAGRSAPGPSSGRRGQERLRPAPSAGRPWTRRRMWRCSPSA